ncbi:MAG: hypothetical protein JWL69_3266 [Phycisphaerales bacterium]|nr:hypothetical protein [Phycisphaerales bacterium]
MIIQVRLTERAQRNAGRFQAPARGVELLFVRYFAEDKMRVGLEKLRKRKGGFDCRVGGLNGTLGGG